MEQWRDSWRVGLELTGIAWFESGEGSGKPGDGSEDESIHDGIIESAAEGDAVEPDLYGAWQDGFVMLAGR